MSDVTPYSPAEIEFCQSLLDRYSEFGGLVDLGDNANFMAVVRKHYGEPIADRATSAARIASLEAALRGVRDALQTGDIVTADDIIRQALTEPRT